MPVPPRCSNSQDVTARQFSLLARVSCPRHIGVAHQIDGDAVAIVSIVAAQVGRILKPRSVSVHFRHESVWGRCRFRRVLGRFGRRRASWGSCSCRRRDRCNTSNGLRRRYTLDLSSSPSLSRRHCLRYRRRLRGHSRQGCRPGRSHRPATRSRSSPDPASLRIR